MKRSSFAMVVFVAACGGSRPATSAPTDGAAPAAASAATPRCVAARTTRGEAADLDARGHETLALAKLDGANATCPEERTASAALEWKLLAAAGKCGRVRAAPSGAPGVMEARATCDAREAPSKGTEATMRAKMREAFLAERAEDWARAKALYLAAWAEHHPSPRAIESAARMAALAGDAAESRRLRDRALLEAEASEHAVPELTERVRVAGGMPHLGGRTLLLAQNGKVVARDVESRELRVLVDAKGGLTTLSPSGMLAVTIPQASLEQATTATVWDVVTGGRLFQVHAAVGWAFSPDDTRMLVRDGTSTYDASARERVLDASTGAVVARPAVGVLDAFFSPDASHLALYGDASGQFSLYDLTKRAVTGELPAAYDVGAASPDGRYFTYLERVEDGAPLHVRDMSKNEDVATLTGFFHSLEALAVSPDGKTVATGSRNSLRLWDVARKKQTFEYDTRVTDGVTDSRYPNQFAFSDDGKTMVLAGNGPATAWAVATGKRTPLATEQPAKKVLRLVPAPDGVAVVLADEVRIVPVAGAPRSVCRGTNATYDPNGPTNVAYSPSGKSFACVMSSGRVHVFDTAIWKERAVVKRGPKSTAARPADLAFSADDETLTVTNDRGSITYDAASAAVVSRLVLRHPGGALAPRHARFDDGTIAVRTWNGSLALFGPDGALQRDVKLPPALPMHAVDAFAPDGSAYAVAVGKTLHVVDLASGEARSIALPSAARSIAVSRGGAMLAVAVADRSVSIVSGATVTPLAGASGTRVWIAGKSVLVALADDTVGVFVPGGPGGPVLEVDPDGVVARDATGAFELRGRPEVQCLVGGAFLTEETCADGAKAGLAADWIRAAAAK